MARQDNRISSFNRILEANERRKAPVEPIKEQVNTNIPEPPKQAEKEPSVDFTQAVKNKRRMKKEDIFKPSSVRLHKDITKELDKIARKEGYGFKQDFINYAIAKVLEEEFGIKTNLI